MLNPQPKDLTASWYSKLRMDEAREVVHLETLMAALEAAYRVASKRREALRGRAHARKGPPEEVGPDPGGLEEAGVEITRAAPGGPEHGGSEGG